MQNMPIVCELNRNFIGKNNQIINIDVSLVLNQKEIELLLRHLYLM